METKVKIFRVSGAVIIVLLICLYVSPKSFKNSSNAYYNLIIKKITDKLRYENHVSIMKGRDYVKGRSLIYVLGGTQKSMINKLKTAAILLNNGLSDNVFILNEDGITEYDNELNRNLTNNEWKILQLKRYGIEYNKIEFGKISNGYFGTYNEGKGVIALAVSRDVQCLILVTSSYHTLRTWITFRHFNENNSMDMYIYGADEEVGIKELFSELFKLFIYDKYIIVKKSYQDNISQKLYFYGICNNQIFLKTLSDFKYKNS